MPETMSSATKAPGAEGPGELELDRLTHEIARSHGCDRGFFSVCWAEHEHGAVCRCKEEARAALAQREATR